MCEGYDWYYECQECLEIIFDIGGHFPENCPECGSSQDTWKRIDDDKGGK